MEKKLEDLEQKKKQLLGDYDLSESKLDDKSLEELKELEDKMSEVQEKRQELQQKYDLDKEEVEGNSIEELDSFEEKLKKKRELVEHLTDYGYEKEDLAGKSLEELDKTIDKVKTKKELMGELGVDMPDEQISEIELQQLQDLKQEKEERKELIESLSEKGIDREKLEQSSTGDLRKLKSEMESDNQEQPEEEHDKEQEEINEEAEEDLEMLMGSVQPDQAEETEDKNKDPLKAFKDAKKQFSDSWNNLTSKEKEGKDQKNVKRKKMMDLLEEYRQMDTRESSIKTAQVLKGYLETLMSIKRELTYGELAESLKEVDEGDENVETLIQFYETMEQSEYMGQIPISDMTPILNAAENTVSELS